MTRGFIDSASVYELVCLYSHSDPNSAYPWAWHAAIQVSCALLTTPSLRIAPAPREAGGASGAYGKMMRAMGDLVSPTRPDPAADAKALELTKRWARRNSVKIRDIYGIMQKDERNLPRWMDTAITLAWEEHAARLGGLFNEQFIPQISRILDVGDGDLRDVLRQSQDPSIVRHYVREKPDQDGFRLLKDAYFVSALIRGPFHDYVARERQQQILHHPFRRELLPRLTRNPKLRFEITNTADYLSLILAAAPFAESDPESRALHWVESVRKARTRALSGDLDLQQKHYESTALETAIAAAKKIGVRLHPRRIEKMVDALLAFGIGALGWLSLSPWVGVSATAAGVAIAVDGRVGKRVAQRAYLTERRLRSISSSVPGRLEDVWRPRVRD